MATRDAAPREKRATQGKGKEEGGTVETGRRRRQ